MDDTKRIAIAFAVIFVVIMLWQFLFRTPTPARTQKTLPEPETTEKVVSPPVTKNRH